MEKSKMQKGTIKVLWNLHATLVRINPDQPRKLPEPYPYVPKKDLKWPAWPRFMEFFKDTTWFWLQHKNRSTAKSLVSIQNSFHRSNVKKEKMHLAWN